MAPNSLLASILVGMFAIVSLHACDVSAQQDTSPSDVPAPIGSLGKPLPNSTTASRPSLPARLLPTPPPIEPVVLASVALAANTTPQLKPTASDHLSRELQGIVIRSMSELDPSKFPSVEAAKEKLVNAIYHVETYVGVETARGQAWSNFLELDAIKQELEAEQPSFAKLVKYEMNMRQNYIGLEYGLFVRMRTGLNNMVRALKYGADPERSIKILNRRMEALIEMLDEPPVGSDAGRSSAVGLVATYLHESGQTPWAVSELRQKYSLPNVQITVRENLLNRLLSRGVAEPTPVNECLLGTRIIGRACLTGNVSVDVLPMSGGVSMNLNLTGTLTSNNRGFNRGVVLHTTGTSPIFASKQIYITPAGISSSPATVVTNLFTQIHAIEHRFRIVRRIARRKAAQQKPLADSIAQHRMQRRIQERYDTQVNEQLAEAGGQLTALQQRQHPPELTRLAIPSPTLGVYSSNDTVNADVVQAASFQLAASKPCGIAKPLSSDVVIETHQSVVINMLETLLGGRTIRNHDLDDFAQQFLGEVPPEIQSEVDGDPWEISFAAFNPVQLELDDNQIRVTLRITRMKGKDRDLGRGATISVVYDPSYRQGILTLRRSGELEIDIQGVRSSIQATSLRSVVKAKFDPIFKQEIVIEQVKLSQLLPNAPAFKINSIKIDDGWLQVGIR